jgi:alpha-galactosidase
MTKLDDFTLGLLTNVEMIDVNLDTLGKQAGVVSKSGEIEIWAKDLEDGSKAVGLFNRGEREAVASARWEDLRLRGRQVVRDLWRHKDLGRFEGVFSAPVPRHGVVLLRIGAAQN